MPNNLQEPKDSDEALLWEASRRYMNGSITVDELEQIEQKHAKYLKKAIFRLALRNNRQDRYIRIVSDDDRERYLWMVSRRYMAGDLTVEQLEENELAHTQRLNRAMIHLVLWKFLYGFLGLVLPGKRGYVTHN